MATYSTVTVQDDCCIGIAACDEVIVCLDDSWAAKTVSGCAFVLGTVVTVNRVVEVVKKTSCVSNLITCKPVTGDEHCDYIVKITLDDQTLVDPETELPYTIDDEDATGVVPNLCIYQKLLDCADAGSTIPFTVVDTASLDLTVTPAAPQELSGDVNISADVGNIITIEPDGLFAEQIPFTITDTTSVDLTVGGSIPQNLSATVVISADVGNQLSLHGDGLFAACCGDEGSPLSVTDTQTIDLTINPTFPQILSADVEISADVGNIIETHADGLYVPTGGGEGCGPLSVTDTATVNLTINPECDQTLSADVIVCPDIEGTPNALSVEECGLFVPLGAEATLTMVTETACTQTITLSTNLSGGQSASIQLRDTSIYNQVGNGFSLEPYGMLPLAWDGVQFVVAQADAIANQALVMAIALIGPDFIQIARNCFHEVEHGLTVGIWYALDPAVAGNVVPASDLDPDVDVYELLFFTLTDTCVMIDIQPCECAPDLPIPPDPETIVSEDFEGSGEGCDREAFWTGSIDATQYSPTTAETPYVASPTHSGSCAGHYYLQEGTDEKTPFSLYKNMTFNEIYMEFWLYFEGNPGPLPFPWGGQKLARIGSTLGNPPTIPVPFVFMESPPGSENGTYQVYVIDDLGNQIYLNQDDDFFPDDTWVKLAWYVKLNTPGIADGTVKYYYNDALMDGATDLIYRQTGNTDEWDFFSILLNNSWGSGAGAPTYPGFPFTTVPAPGGHMYIDDVLVLTTKPGALP